MYTYHRKLERNVIDATCDGALRDKVRRRKHMPSHTGEGPYQCNMSGGAFISYFIIPLFISLATTQRKCHGQWKYINVTNPNPRDKGV